MRASSRSEARRGIGALVALVSWVIAIALIWALMQGQATSGALTGVIRVSGLTTLTVAGESALDEASIALRHPAGGKSTVLEAIRTGTDAGEADDPRVTRELFADDISAGVLKLENVRYKVVHRGANRLHDPWLIDLSVRVTFTRGSVAMTRLVTRRHTGHVCEVRICRLKGESKPVYTSFSMDRLPVMQLVEP